MRILRFLKSIYGRVHTIYERSSDYDYWKQAVVAIFVGVIFSVGILYGLYQVSAWMVSVSILAIISVAAYYRRKRFLSPSSVQLQATLFFAIQRIKRVQGRNTIRMVLNALERRPYVGAVFAPILCLMAFFVVTAALNRLLQGYSIARSVVETVWIVHATVTGFSFIVLIFFWEFLRDEFDNEVFIRTAVRYTWALHIIYFLLAANVVIGVLAALSQRQQVAPFLGIQAVLFVLSMYGVYRIYDTVYTVMVKETLTPRIKRRLDQKIGIILTEQNQETWLEVVNHQLEPDYPQMALPDFTGKQVQRTASDLGLNGEVTDIHLHRLQNLLEEATALDVDIERLPVLGQSYQNDDLLFVYKGNLTGRERERLQNRLLLALKVK